MLCIFLKLGQGVPHMISFARFCGNTCRPFWWIPQLSHLYSISLVDSSVVWIPQLSGFLSCLDSSVVWIPQLSGFLSCLDSSVVSSVFHLSYVTSNTPVVLLNIYNNTHPPYLYWSVYMDTQFFTTH